MPKRPLSPAAVARRRRDIIIQALVVAAVFGFAALIIATTAANLRARGIPLGFEFLTDRAGFNLSETVVPFSPDDTNLRAIAAGVGNSLFVSVIVGIIATAAGLLLGIARLGANPLVDGLSRVVIEAGRNSPPILLLIFIYALWWQVLPSDRALDLPGGSLMSIRGLAIPWPRGGADGIFIDWPTATATDISGGLSLSPELATILIGLSFYTAGFIAEIVRAGLLAVPRGQWEAAAALGLPRGLMLRRIIVPQMLRVIVPPMTSQYINIVKNSTLVIAVGYVDFLTVMGTVINKTSHAIEGTVIIIIVYLAINLGLSMLFGWVNRRVALQGR